MLYRKCLLSIPIGIDAVGGFQFGQSYGLYFVNQQSVDDIRFLSQLL